jgi:glycosyltransferase involved in cell wall biosynthesis
MRILLVTQVYEPFWEGGGPAVKVRALAERLAARGHGITVLTVSHGPAQPPGAVERKGVEARYLAAGLRYRSLTLNPGAAAFCRSSLRRFDAAHVFGLYDFLGPTVASQCRRCGLPYVVEPMGMARPVARSLRLKRLYLALLGTHLLRGAHAVIATSEQEKHELVADGLPESKVVVRRNGVEAPGELPPAGVFRRRYGVPEDARLVLFLGRLVTKKSPDLLLEAFARCPSNRTQAQPPVLVLAGPDEGDGYRARLEAQARHLGLAGRVHFPGGLYEKAKWAALRDADVFVLPSQHENFGNAVAEAMACGTPVVVTDRCGIAPWVEGRAGLVVPHETGALAAALRNLLEDDALREQFAARGLQAARQLTWDEPVREMELIYERLARAESTP